MDKLKVLQQQLLLSRGTRLLVRQRERSNVYQTYN